MESTAKDRFEAAVNVIKSLPKNGSFQPSHDLMLKFYAYYKQATLGPCNIPKPSFWDVVGKAKWDAWKNLGTMKKEEAMKSYVEELKQVLPEDKNYVVSKIIETMPQTQMVADFIEKLGSFYELVDENEAAVKTKKEREEISKTLDRRMNGNIGLLAEETIPDIPEENEAVPLMLLDSDKDVDTKSDPEGDEHPDDLHNNNHAQNAELSEHLAEKNGREDVEETNVKNALNGETSAHIITVKPPSTSTPLKPNKKDSAGEPDQDDQPNGRGVQHGINGHVTPRFLASDTDSDVDEFCDTSDQLVQVHDIPSLIPARIPDHVTRMGTQTTSSGTTIQTAVDVHHPGPQSSMNPSDNASSHNVSGRSSLNGPSSSSSSPNQGSASPVQSSVLHSSQPNLQTDTVMSRGGGNNPVAGQPSGVHSNTMTNPTNTRNPGVDHHVPGATPTSSRSLPAGGAGGSGGSSPEQYYAENVNEQIAVALIRLQQDMNQVLTRLNTLETHAILQRQLRDAEETKKEKNLPSWWPFSNLPGRTILFILVWPLVLRWVTKLLFRRRKTPR